MKKPRSTRDIETDLLSKLYFGGDELKAAIKAAALVKEYEDAVRSDQREEAASDPEVLKKIDALILAAKAEARAEAIFNCDTECRKVADRFYRESLTKEPDDRLAARFQHDGASACVGALRALKDKEPECATCGGKGSIVKQWPSGAIRASACPDCKKEL